MQCQGCELHGLQVCAVAPHGADKSRAAPLCHDMDEEYVGRRCKGCTVCGADVRYCIDGRRAAWQELWGSRLAAQQLDTGHLADNGGTKRGKRDTVRQFQPSLTLALARKASFTSPAVNTQTSLLHSCPLPLCSPSGFLCALANPHPTTARHLSSIPPAAMVRSPTQCNACPIPYPALGETWR
jgi:hypothetical protein